MAAEPTPLDRAATLGRHVYMSHGPVQPGDVLAGKYRVERILGKGNMGVVVAATHVELGQRVALKFMLGQPDAEQRERFLREARALVRLRSHHVAHVIDVGTLEDGAPYIVMELLEGRDLAAIVKDGPMHIERAVEYLLHACEAVGEAHAAGIVHRDLKPANLFLTHDVSGAPCVKVLDFGISKLAGGMDLTQTTQALGSPLYMSPEQMNSSRDVDSRSDVWALGVTLYQLVAGKTPFHADTVQALCARVLFTGPTPLAEYVRSPPPGFEAAIMRCIEREVDQRFRNVAELAAAIAPFAPASARLYPERVARVLGVPLTAAPRDVAAPEAGSTVVMHASHTSAPSLAGPPPPSTVLMTQSPFASPTAAANAPAYAAQLAPPPSSVSQPVVAVAASQPVARPTAWQPATPGAPSLSASSPAVMAGTAITGPADSGISLAASQLSPPMPSRSRAPLFLAGGAFVLAVCAVALTALRGGGTPPAPAAPTAEVTPAAGVTNVATTRPDVAPAEPLPSPSTSAAASASASVAPTVQVPVPKGPFRAPKAASTGSKPSVSYDERN